MQQDSIIRYKSAYASTKFENLQVFNQIIHQTGDGGKDERKIPQIYSNTHTLCIERIKDLANERMSHSIFNEYS
jgi:hypothetical protein